MSRVQSLSIVVFLFSVAAPRTTFADLTPAFIVGWGSEKIIKLAELPNEAKFEGKHIAVGYVYKRFTVCFIPVWNYDGRYCGYLGNDRAYVIMEDENEFLDAIKKMGVQLPPGSPIPFMDRIGWKLIIFGVFVIVAVCANLISSKTSSDDPELGPDSQSPQPVNPSTGPVPPAPQPVDSSGREATSEVGSTPQQGWYYTVGGREKGPVSDSQLKVLIETGALSPNDQVRRADDDKWCQVQQIKGLS